MSRDLGKLANEMIEKSKQDDGSNFIEASLLTEMEAIRLTVNYLQGYKPRMVALNPHIPEVSSYVVAISGGQNA